MLLFGTYTTELGAYWFFERYFSPIFLLAPVLGAVLLTDLARRGWGISLGQRRLGAGVVGAVLVVGLSISGAIYTAGYATSPNTIKRGYAPPMAYGAVAQSFLPDLPSGTGLGAFQSGALAYYAPEGIRVVNLDGVVNGAAAEALRQRSMCAYLAATGLTHFMDSEINRRFLMAARGRGAEIALTELRTDQVVPGQHLFTLWDMELTCAGHAE